MTEQLKIIFLFLLPISSSQLIRSADVYKGVIEGTCDYYQCFSITMFYSGYPRTQDIDVMTRLKNLSLYFEKELLIQTSVTDIESYATYFSRSRFKSMVKPIFILLNDFDDMRLQFSKELVSLVDISKPMWIIFMQDETSIEDFFDDVYIPFNCKFMVSKKSPDIESSEIIAEVYQVYYGRQLKQNIFATWNISTGLTPPFLSFNQRRTDLDQINLRVSVTDYPPLVSVRRNEYDRVIKADGVYVRVMEELQKKLNFSVTYSVSTSAGWVLPNGTLIGVIKSISENLIDMTATIADAVYGSSKVLDFTTQIFDVEFRIYTRKSTKRVLYWDKFIRPFEPLVWQLVGFIVLAGSVVIFIIKFVERKKLNGTKKLTDESPSFLKTFLSVLGVFCNQGMSNGQLVSLQLVQFTLHITAVITLAAYSAILISFLTTHTTVNSVTTTEEILDHKSLILTGTKGFTDYLSLENETDELLSRVFKRVMENKKEFPPTRSEGVKRLCSNKNFALVTGQLAGMGLNMVNCSLAAMDVLVMAPISIILQRNSPFRRAINNHLTLMREAGVLRKILRNMTVMDDKVDEIWSTVELIDIVSLMAFLTGGYIVSLLIMLGEKIIYMKLSTKLNTKQRLVVRVKPLIHEQDYADVKNSLQKRRKKSLADIRVMNSKNAACEKKLNACDGFETHSRLAININPRKC